MGVIAITGKGGGRMNELCDTCIALPERETYLVQELTLPVYHWICAELETAFFG
jgi:D-sedoheptulose 7-phosphate isomerase